MMASPSEQNCGINSCRCKGVTRKGAGMSFSPPPLANSWREGKMQNKNLRSYLMVQLPRLKIKTLNHISIFSPPPQNKSSCYAPVYIANSQIIHRRTFNALCTRCIFFKNFDLSPPMFDTIENNLIAENFLPFLYSFPLAEFLEFLPNIQRNLELILLVRFIFPSMYIYMIFAPIASRSNSFNGICIHRHSAKTALTKEIKIFKFCFFLFQQHLL